MNVQLEQSEKLVTALREELETYGGILAALDNQQDAVMARAADALMDTVHQIHGQMGEVEQARARREVTRHSAALAFGLREDSTFREIIPALPHHYQGLVTALVDENNELLVRVQQRTRQNHLLLRRSVDLMQSFLSSLFPRQETQVYDQRGGLPGRVIPIRSIYEAVG